MAFKNPFANNKELSSDNEKHEHDLDLGAFPASKEKRIEEKLEFPETSKASNESSTSGIPTNKTSLSPMRVDVTQNHDETSNKLFAQLMDNDDEEEVIHTQMKESGMDKLYDNSTDDNILDTIAKNIVTLRKKYPTGGVKASRYITTDVLMRASTDYFDKYQKDVAEGVRFVRDQLSNVDGASGDIKAAQDNPIDDALQDKAYYKVHSLASDFTRTSGWRDTHRAIVISMICNEIIGFSRIDPLWRDRKIDEIICNGPKDIQIEIRGELYKVPGCSFDSQKQLMDFIDRLYSAINKVVSLTTPLVKGRLHDKSRMYVTHPALAPDGPNFSIRRHPERFWTPNDFVKNGSSDAEMMAYIGNLVYKGASCLVIGGTHSGKAQPLSTIIHTPTGITTMGEIMPGDRVFDHNGKVATVTNIFPQPLRQVYALELSNGETSYADAEHNWWVSTHQSRKSNKYRKTHKTNNGWERKTNWDQDVIANIEKAISNLDFNNENSASLSVISETIGKKINSGSKAHSLLKETSKFDEIANTYNIAEALKTLLAYAQNNRNDQREKRSPLYSVMTTKEMMESGTLLHHGDKKRFQFHVPTLKESVEYENGLEPEDFAIHPYLFGLWLGDGSSRGNGFTSAKDDVDSYINKFEELKIDSTFTLKKNAKHDWKITQENFIDEITKLGVRQKTTAEGSKKDVPNIYKYASIESRRMLIAGLIDSDGWVDTRVPGWVFTNTNENIIDGYVQVAASLGYKVNKSNPKNKSYDYKGEKQRGKDSWDVSINTHDKLAFLDRKNLAHDEMTAKIGASLGRQDEIAITKIYPVEGRFEEMKCITVDSPDSTYMMDKSFITTHNTSMLNALTGFYKPKVRILTLEDNIEMKPNPKKYLAAALECREPASDRPDDHGIGMKELVKASSQLRPDVIIVGEITDEAAFHLCQALNTGHAGASTIHANSSELAIPRVAALIAQGGIVSMDGALEMISSGIDFIVSLKHFPVDGSRRIVSVDEIGLRPTMQNGRLTLPINPLWKFQETGLDENRKVTGHWIKVGDISQERQDMRLLNIEDDLTWDELKELSSIPGQE